MKNFNPYYLILLVSTLFSINLYSQTEDSLQISDIMNLSIEDLMKIKESVSSSKSQNVFETPSTVTIIDQEMILNSRTTCTCQVFSQDSSKLKHAHDTLHMSGVFTGQFYTHALHMPVSKS